MYKYLFILIFIISTVGTKAQIGINTVNPNSLSELDIQNAINSDGVIPKGVLLPRLTKDQIALIDVKTDVDKANSLFVYNTDEDCYNYFSKTKDAWVSLCGGEAGGGNATYTLDCSKTQVFGTYTAGTPLNSSNYVTVYVTVTKPGNYALSAVSENGYYFSASGDFLIAGTYPINLMAAGTPIERKTETLNVINGSSTTPICSFEVDVVFANSEYTINCDSTVVSGVYELGVPLKSTNTIKLYVNVTAIGGWEVTSNTVDGISFKGTGNFTTTGNQWITVTGTGIPTSNDTKTMTLLVKSSSATSTGAVYCTATVRMIIASKTIGAVARAGYNLVQPADGTVRQSSIFLSEYNFGPLDNSIVKMYKPELYKYNTANTAPIAGSSATTIKNWLYNSGSTLDAMFFTLPASIGDAAAAQVVADYLINGGVIILCSSQVPSAPSYIGSKRIYTTGTGDLALMKLLFGEQVTLKIKTWGDKNTWKLPYSSASDLTLNGPFGDLRGQYLTTSDIVYPIDGSTNNYLNAVAGVSYDGIPVSKLDWYITATNYNSSTAVPSSDIVAFKAKDYNFIWISDPGIFYFSGDTSGATMNIDLTSKVTGSAGTQINTYQPTNLLGTVSYSPTGQGLNNSQYNTVNSKFMANILMWAINAAQYGGINNRN